MKRDNWTTETFDTFVQAARAALLFSFPGPKALTDQENTFTFVTAAVRDNFFQRTDGVGEPVLVDRPQIGIVTSALRSRRGVLLTGERGTGKSTIIYAALHQLGALSIEFLRQFELDERVLVHRVESERVHIHFNANFIASSEEQVDAIDRPFFYTSVEARLLGFQEGTQARQWDLWRLDRDEFAHLKGRLKAMGLALDIETWSGNPADLVEELQRLWVQAEEAWHAKLPVERCLALIEFTLEVLKVDVTICIDNSDHLPLQDQQLLVEALVDLRRRSRVPFGYIVSMRPETAHAIRWPFVGDAMFDKVATEEPHGEIGIIGKVIERRLSIVTSSTLRQRLLDQFGDSGDAIAEISNEVMTATLDLVRHFFETNEENRAAGVSTVPLVELFVDWYNKSIRLIALSLVEFMSKLLQDRHSAFPLRHWLNGVATDWSRTTIANQRQIESLARTAIYHHLVEHCQLFRAAWTDERDANIMVLVPRHGDVRKSVPAFQFLRLRILQALLHRRLKRSGSNGSLRIGKLEDMLLKEFGVPHSRTRLAIAELAYPRFPDDSGLLRIDQLARENLSGTNPTRVASWLKRDWTIELLPAGRLLAQRLIYTCEFLFLSLIYSGNFSILPAAGKSSLPTGRDFRNNHQRVLGASLFVSRVLLPAFLREHPYLEYAQGVVVLDHDDRITRLHSFVHEFGFGPPDNWMLSKAITGIAGHAGSRLGSDAYNDVRAEHALVMRFVEGLNQIASSL